MWTSVRLAEGNRLSIMSRVSCAMLTVSLRSQLFVALTFSFFFIREFHSVAGICIEWIWTTMVAMVTPTLLAFH